ncbi:MAG TPA: hypothetical protein VMR37_00340 [Rhabdochlamydiaceae bacterium]|nr:hypothetical protein [Rhabdochlamydiaceae bacterium]
MNRRQLIGWIVVAVGIVLIILSVHWIHEFAKIKVPTTTHIKIFFTENPLWNPVIEFFGGKPQAKPPAHDVRALFIQGFGIFLVVVGGLIALVFRRKK